jgi:putative membrane protein
MSRIAPVMFTIVVIGLNTVSNGCALLQEILPGVSLSDSSLVSVLNNLDKAEIEAARLAQDKASDPDVKAFAGRVLHEHRHLTESHERLAAHLSLSSDHPALAGQLEDAHGVTMRELRSLSGPSFDRAYVDHEIKAHVRAFHFLETAAGSEDNPLLRQELVRTGPDLLSHISAARALERHLGPTTPGAIAAVKPPGDTAP